MNHQKFFYVSISWIFLRIITTFYFYLFTTNVSFKNEDWISSDIARISGILRPIGLGRFIIIFTLIKFNWSLHESDVDAIHIVLIRVRLV